MICYTVGSYSTCNLKNSNFAFWVILHAFLLSADFFLNSTFSEKPFHQYLRVSNSLDPDQDQCFLGPNCLQRLSADNTSRLKLTCLTNGAHD